MTNSANNSDVLKWYFENEKNLTILAKGKKNPIIKNWLDKLIPYSKITEYSRNLTMATISGLCCQIQI